MLARRQWLFAMAALLPILAIFAWVRFYPIEETLRMSLHEWNLISKTRPCIGLANFQELFGDQLFRTAQLYTTIIAFGTLVVTIPIVMGIESVII